MSSGIDRNGTPRSRRAVWIGVAVLVVVLGVVAIVIGLSGGSDGRAGAVATDGAVTTSGSAVAPSSSPTRQTSTTSAAGRATDTAAPPTSPGVSDGSSPTASPPAIATSASAVPGGAGAGTEQPSVAAAEKIGDTAAVARDVSVRVTGIEATQGVAQGVGERSGPAVRITFELKNNTGRPVSTSSAVANVDYGKNRLPADELRGERPSSFASSIAPGSTTTASFIYLVPADERGDLRITFFLDPTTPAAQFTGSAA